MGERVSGTLTILASQAKEALEIIEEADNGCPDSEDETPSGLVHLTYEQVNYGELHGLSNLEAAGIAFNWFWDRGYDWGPGTHFLRFTEHGEAVFKTKLDENPENLHLAELLALLDQPDPLERIRAYLLERQEQATILPWENQEEYGKRARALRLIL